MGEWQAGSGSSDDDAPVFRALADPGRRALLDALYLEDGQSLTALCAVLPDLTRFGVMKHLGVLAEANLVLTEKDGRIKRHYLNPVPVRRIHDRWMAKYAAAPAAALIELATSVEARPVVPESTPRAGGASA